MFLKFKKFTGPKDFEFKDPDTGFLYKEKSLNELHARIAKYRLQNGLPAIEFLPQVVENYLCHKPLNSGSCEASKPFKRGIAQYIEGGIALLKNFAYQKFAPQDVADARSAQCASCVFNTFPDLGPFITWSNEIAIDSVGDRKSSHHDSLGICSACSCPLRAKVFYDGPIALTQEQVTEMSTVSCWQVPLAKITKLKKAS